MLKASEGIVSQDLGKPAQVLKSCLRQPVPEIFDAARYLDAAVSAHMFGRRDLTEELIRLADMPSIREWTESLWGKESPYVRPTAVHSPLPRLPVEQRVASRMPPLADQRALHERDGYHCRFCGIPVIRREIRQRIARSYSAALPWGKRNVEQHAAFQAMWAQYDHIVPHARGGDNSVINMLVTCAPCNFGRMTFTVEEVGLEDPRERAVNASSWDGLERFL